MVNSPPDDPNTLLTRRDAAAALRAAGFPIAEKTLATRATRGGGPPYSLFSGRALYRWGDALDWARSITTPPRRSTSEADARRAEGRRTEDASPRPFHAAAQGAAPARRG